MQAAGEKRQRDEDVQAEGQIEDYYNFDSPVWLVNMLMCHLYDGSMASAWACFAELCRQEGFDGRRWIGAAERDVEAKCDGSYDENSSRCLQHIYELERLYSANIEASMQQLIAARKAASAVEAASRAFAPGAGSEFVCCQEEGFMQAWRTMVAVAPAPEMAEPPAASAPAAVEAPTAVEAPAGVEAPAAVEPPAVGVDIPDIYVEEDALNVAPHPWIEVALPLEIEFLAPIGHSFIQAADGVLYFCPCSADQDCVAGRLAYTPSSGFFVIRFADLVYV